MEKPKPWYRRRPALIGWVSVGLIILAVLGLGQLRQHLTERKIEAKLAAIRAQGLPVTLSETDEFYTKVPDAENGASILLKYRNHHVEWDIYAPWIGDLSSNSVLIVTNPFTPQARMALSGIVASNQVALQHIHHAASKSKWRYPCDLTQWPNSSLTEQWIVISPAVKLLRIESLHFLAEKQNSRAVKSVETSLLVSDSLAAEPLLLSLMVRNTCLSMTLKTIEKLLNRDDFAASDILRLQEAIALSDSKTDLLRVIHGERGLIVGSWNQPVSQHMGGGPYSPATPFDHWPAPVQRAGWAFYETGGFQSSDLLNFLNFFNDLESAAKQPPIIALRQAESISERFASRSKPALDMILTTYSGSILVHAIKRNAGLLAEYRTVQVGLAVERYRLEKGQLPKQLGDLLPIYLKDAPIDPFSGAPLLYRITDKGFYVYSVGENGRDDGAKESPRPLSDDVTFSVER